MLSIREVYRKYYKQLMIIPVLVFLLLLTGLPHLKLGIDFVGGFSLSFHTQDEVDIDSLVLTLKEELNVVEVSVIPLAGGYIIEFTYPPRLQEIYDLFRKYEGGDEAAKRILIEVLETNDIESGINKATDNFIEKVKEIVLRYAPNAKDITIREVAPIAGEDFWNAMIWIAITAIFLLLLVVIIYFRHPVPIVIILLSTLFDGIAILALMGLTDIPLTLATMAIVLMMMGYSIDTDMVASTYVFKRRAEEGVFNGAERAFKTGITMTLTTLASMIIIYIVGTITANITVVRIANVMIYGLIADILITWFFNTPLLIWVGEKHASKR